MSDMELRIPVALEAAQLERLRTVLGEDLERRLGELASAALTEYALAFSGVRAPSTMRELRELRLRLLFEHMSGGHPTDEEIAGLFQTTPSQTATLIAGTRARFPQELGGRLRDAAVAVLAEARPVDEDTVRIRAPDSLGRYLKDLVARTAAPPLDKRRDASQTYDLTRSTVEALCRQLGVEADTVSALEWG
jgi:hypothetical protein